MERLLAVTRNSDASQWRLLVLMAIGFVIGIAGHVYGSRRVVAIGVALIFLAAFLIPLTHAYG
jgi:hypothetical protein